MRPDRLEPLGGELVKAAGGHNGLSWTILPSLFHMNLEMNF